MFTRYHLSCSSEELHQAVDEDPLPPLVAGHAGHHPGQGSSRPLVPGQERDVMNSHGKQLSGVDAVD